MIDAFANRGILAVGVATIGAAWCLGNDHYWQTKLDSASAMFSPGAFASVGGDLVLVAVPFYALALAVAMAGRPRPIGTLVTVAALGALTSFEYWANGTSTSSTAPVVFALSIIYGIPLVVASVLLQVLVDSRRARRERMSVAGPSDADQVDWAHFMAKGNERM